MPYFVVSLQTKMSVDCNGLNLLCLCVSKLVLGYCCWVPAWKPCSWSHPVCIYIMYRTEWSGSTTNRGLAFICLMYGGNCTSIHLDSALQQPSVFCWCCQHCRLHFLHRLSSAMHGEIDVNSTG